MEHAGDGPRRGLTESMLGPPAAEGASVGDVVRRMLATLQTGAGAFAGGVADVTACSETLGARAGAADDAARRLTATLARQEEQLAALARVRDAQADLARAVGAVEPVQGGAAAALAAVRAALDAAADAVGRSLRARAADPRIAEVLAAADAQHAALQNVRDALGLHG